MTLPSTAELRAACVTFQARKEYPDLVPKVSGGTAGGVQALLCWLAERLEPGMTYLEAGSWLGKSIIAPAKACKAGVTVAACDNYSHTSNQGAEFVENLKGHGVLDRVVRYEKDYAELFKAAPRPERVGVLFYDADHSEAGQYLGLRLAEPFLVPGAVVVVDDWSEAGGSAAVRSGTLRAVVDSGGAFELVHEFPGGNASPWWLGLGVLQFHGGS